MSPRIRGLIATRRKMARPLQSPLAIIIASSVILAIIYATRRKEPCRNIREFKKPLVPITITKDNDLLEKLKSQQEHKKDDMAIWEYPAEKPSPQASSDSPIISQGGPSLTEPTSLAQLQQVTGATGVQTPTIAVSKSHSLDEEKVLEPELPYVIQSEPVRCAHDWDAQPSPRCSNLVTESKMPTHVPLDMPNSKYSLLNPECLYGKTIRLVNSDAPSCVLQPGTDDRPTKLPQTNFETENYLNKEKELKNTKDGNDDFQQKEDTTDNADWDFCDEEPTKTVSELIEEAIKQKEKGNEHFSKNEYSLAVAKYSCAIENMDAAQEALESGTEFSQKEISKFEPATILSIIYSNRSAAYYSLGQFQEAVEDASDALQFNPAYFKAYIRRARAYQSLEKWSDAVADFETAFEKDSQLEAKYATLVEQLRQQAKIKLEKEKEEMIGKAKELGNFLLGKVGLSLDNFKVNKNDDGGSYNIQFVQNPN